MRRPQAPEKKATRESKPWVAQGMGRKAKLVSRKPLPKAKPPMNSTAAPGAGKPPVSILSQVVARGQFQKVPESLALQAGDALELRCRGRAVRWRYPAHLQDDEEGRLRYVAPALAPGSVRGRRGRLGSGTRVHNPCPGGS